MLDKYLNKIIKGNCIDLLQQLPPASVDLFLEDMPYNTTACSWEHEVDLKEYWEIRKKLIKPTGIFVLTANQPFTTDLISSNRKGFKYNWTWDKVTCSNPFLAKKQPMRATEDVLIFGDGKTYNPILLDKPPANIRRNNIEVRQDLEVYAHKKTMGRNDAREIPPEKMYPTNIIKIVNDCRYKDQYHPTQKPVGLFEYLIKTYTNEGDLVVDGYSGSGTTAVAAIRTNRNFICFEREEEYCAIANERIKNEKRKMAEICYTNDLALFSNVSENTA